MEKNLKIWTRECKKKGYDKKDICKYLYQKGYDESTTLEVCKYYDRKRSPLITISLVLLVSLVIVVLCSIQSPMLKYQGILSGSQVGAVISAQEVLSDKEVPKTSYQTSRYITAPTGTGRIMKIIQVDDKQTLDVLSVNSINIGLKDSKLVNTDIPIRAYYQNGSLKSESKIKLSLVSSKQEIDVSKLIDDWEMLHIGDTSTIITYVPNSTSGGAWKGADSSNPSTPPDTLTFDSAVGTDTAYTGVQLNTISADDSNYVSAPNGQADFDFGHGHRVMFKITEDKATINNITVRMVIETTENKLIHLFAWNHTSASWGSSLANAKTGNISSTLEDISNYVNASGDLYILAYSVLVGGNGGTNLLYAEAKVDYTEADSTKPIITINMPQNTTYTDKQINFNVSLNEAGDTCKFSLNNWATNTTMTKITTTTFGYFDSNMANAQYTCKYSCNDTSGNINMTTSRMFYVNYQAPVNVTAFEKYQFQNNGSLPPTSSNDGARYGFNETWGGFFDMWIPNEGRYRCGYDSTTINNWSCRPFGR